MKPRITYLIVFIFFSLKAFSQNQTTHLNFILFIDDEIVKTGIYDGVIQSKDSLGNTNINFRHQVGELIFTSEDYSKLVALSPNSKVIISFKYRQICPSVTEYEYSKEVSLDWLLQRYVIFKVYNYTNKKNHMYFIDKIGYGIEIEIPAKSMLLPRKQMSRAKVNCN